MRGWRKLDLEVSDSVVVSFQITAGIWIVEYVIYDIYIIGVVL